MATPHHARHFLSAFLLSTAFGAVVAQTAVADPIDFNIPSMPLADAIKTVSTIGHINVVADMQLTYGKTAPAVKGSMEPSEALNEILVGSGLAVSADSGGYNIVRVNSMMFVQ